MAELIAKSPLEGTAPITKAGLVLSLAPPGPLWSLALYPGADIDPALRPLGLHFPAPGESSTSEGLNLFWTGRDQAFLAAPSLPEGFAAALAGRAALSDQTGAWAGFTLAAAPGREGTSRPEAALARLVPLDLRPAAFPPGRVARCALNHINMILRRSGEAEFSLLVFRSMAASAWHELAQVLEQLAARETARETASSKS